MSGACAAGHPVRRAADPPTGFSREDLVSRGFEGSVSLRQLPRRPETIPNVSGVYAVVRACSDPVAFVGKSAGGHFKGRDPSVARGTLTRAWINGTDTMYLGRARLLRRRIDELARFGRGESVGHWGGRYLWQLADHDNLLVAWHVATDYVEREAALIDEFRATHGGLPFANLAHPRRQVTP